MQVSTGSVAAGLAFALSREPLLLDGRRRDAKCTVRLQVGELMDLARPLDRQRERWVDATEAPWCRNWFFSRAAQDL